MKLNRVNIHVKKSADGKYRVGASKDFSVG